jgi:hypothetical protein
MEFPASLYSARNNERWTRFRTQTMLNNILQKSKTKEVERKLRELTRTLIVTDTLRCAVQTCFRLRRRSTEATMKVIDQVIQMGGSASNC